MSFGGLTALQFWLGLGALGAVLAALQILRVRQREVSVVTTLFWRQALEQTRARVFRQRFRHVGTWLFLLLICGLLWLAIARPTLRDGVSEHTICLLDGSADMARGRRFAEAVAQLKKDVQGLPLEATDVIYVGGETRTLLAAGEDRLLLARRLASQAPAAAPARLGAVIEDLLRVHAGALTIRVYGDGALPASASLPERVRLARVDTGIPVRDYNLGVVTLGMAEASSGAADAVDVLVALRAEQGGAPVGTSGGALRITLDGRELTLTPESEGLGTGYPRWRYRDVPARGQLLRAALRRGARTDALPLDDSAEIILPNRPLLRVFVDAALHSLLGPVITADPGLHLVASAQEEADVVIRAGAGEPAGGRPTLSFDTTEAGAAAFLIRGPAASGEALLATAERQLALARIDGAALAQRTGRTIGAHAEVAPERRIRVWISLLQPESGFVSSRAFPLFVAGALRWLAGRVELVPYAAAGFVLPVEADTSGYADETGRLLQPLGVAFTPPVAGRYHPRGGPSDVIASLLPDHLPRQADAVRGAAAAPAAPFPLRTLLLLLACGLLCVEWVLYRTGRMP